MTKREIVRFPRSSIAKKLVRILKKAVAQVVVRYMTMMMLEGETLRLRERQLQNRRLMHLGKIRASGKSMLGMG